jgi:hypothetical protein
LDKALVSGSNVDVYVLDTGIVIDLEDFGVPSSFASDFTGEQNHGDYVNATTLSTPEASPVFKEPLVIQGTPEAQFGRSIALSGDGSILAVGAPSFDNEFGSEEGRVSLYQLEGNSANFIFDFSGAQDFELGKCCPCPEAVHQYWPSVVRTLMFIRLVNSWTVAANPLVVEFDL